MRCPLHRAVRFTFPPSPHGPVLSFVVGHQRPEGLALDCLLKLCQSIALKRTGICRNMQEESGIPMCPTFYVLLNCVSSVVALPFNFLVGFFFSNSPPTALYQCKVHLVHYLFQIELAPLCTSPHRLDFKIL